MRHLLMVASTVSPRWGSEGAVGWNWLANVPSGWLTTLLTSKECAEEIRWGLSSGECVPTLSAIQSPSKSWDFRPSSKILRRLNEWAKFRHNLRSFRSLGRRITGVSHVDLIHQTTIATWMCGMPFHSLGIPTVWGPIGGGELFPWRYASQTSVANWIFEGGRVVSRVIAKKTSRIVAAARNVDVIIVTNNQTDELLRELGRTKPTIRQPMVIRRQRFEQIRRRLQPKESGKLRIISGGSIEGRKGFALTIKALAKLKRCGVEFEFTITGHGMELNKLQRLAEREGIQNDVHFETGLGIDEYIQRLTKAHVFCFPSLRDNSPVTLLEAMAAECVPIVLDNGGPAEVVDAECGFVLPLEYPTKTINRLAELLLTISNNRSICSQLSQAGSGKVESAFLDDKLTSKMSDAYDLACKVHASFNRTNVYRAS